MFHLILNLLPVKINFNLDYLAWTLKRTYLSFLEHLLSVTVKDYSPIPCPAVRSGSCTLSRLLLQLWWMGIELVVIKLQKNCHFS